MSVKHYVLTFTGDKSHTRWLYSDERTRELLQVLAHSLGTVVTAGTIPEVTVSPLDLPPPQFHAAEKLR